MRVQKVFIAQSCLNFKIRFSQFKIKIQIYRWRQAKEREYLTQVYRLLLYNDRI